MRGAVGSRGEQMQKGRQPRLSQTCNRWGKVGAAMKSAEGRLQGRAKRGKERERESFKKKEKFRGADEVREAPGL